MNPLKTCGLVAMAVAFSACGSESVESSSKVTPPLSGTRSALATSTPSCAPDPYEIDDADTGVGPPTGSMPITVGSTVRRSICQGRYPMPGKRFARDIDYFVFTAVEGQAYTVEVTEVGPGLVNQTVDSGGLSVFFSSDSGAVTQSSAPNGDRSTTLPLHAGQYLIGATTTDLQTYPDNTLDTKTIEGSDGAYAIKLTATAPPPVLKSLTVSPNPLKAGERGFATLTFTGPLLSGGSFVPVGSSNPSVAAPGGSQIAPGGVTSWKVAVDARRVVNDATVDIDAKVLGVGPTLSTPLTVRK